MPGSDALLQQLQEAVREGGQAAGGIKEKRVENKESNQSQRPKVTRRRRVRDMAQVSRTGAPRAASGGHENVKVNDRKSRDEGG